MAVRDEMGDRTLSDHVLQTGVRPRNIHRPRAESSSLVTSFPNSLNQRTPARSYYQRTFSGQLGRGCHRSTLHVPY